MPPLKPWQTIPVPPPTLPSATGPPRAPSRAAIACSAFTWKPLMSLSTPSQVSATTGSPHGCSPGRDACHCRIASRTTPTLWVLVIAIGPSRNPLSCSHVVPVISPLPFSVNHAPNTASPLVLPRGWTTVTPVRTGPLPTTEPSLLRDERSVWPTSTPATSVIASSAPGVPPMSGTSPSSRARFLSAAAPSAASRVSADRTRTAHARRLQAVGLGRSGVTRGTRPSASRAVKTRAAAIC
jgi:hypothetical protein